MKKPDVVATSPQFFCAVGGWLLSVFKRRPSYSRFGIFGLRLLPRSER